MNIAQIIDTIHPIPEASKAKLGNCLHEIELAKGTTLLQAKRIETHLYFISKGMVRAYSNTADKQITFWFGKEGDAVLSMRSYVENKKSYENIELLEDCTLYQLASQDLQKLFSEDIHIANWGRKLAEKELIKTEERLIAQLFLTSTERYKDLLKHHPHLLQRVPLGYIASYLGITQVSLSRIRADMK